MTDDQLAILREIASHVEHWGGIAGPEYCRRKFVDLALQRLLGEQIDERELKDLRTRLYYADTSPAERLAAQLERNRVRAEAGR